MTETYPKNDSVYKTQNEVEETAKKYGLYFVTYPVISISMTIGKDLSLRKSIGKCI